jgi:hypothetical protein
MSESTKKDPSRQEREEQEVRDALLHDRDARD